MKSETRAALKAQVREIAKILHEDATEKGMPVSSLSENAIPPPALDPAANSWSFLEVWVDPLQAPPYLLMLLSDDSGHCRIVDPAERYQIIESCETYEQAQLWLLEDEYEPLEGRLSEAELHDAT